MDLPCFHKRTVVKNSIKSHQATRMSLGGICYGDLDRWNVGVGLGVVVVEAVVA